MASLQDIRSRIDSVKNTQQITRAMKMVSAAKLKKAQDRITNMRTYAQKLLSIIADIAVSHRVEHPLLSVSVDTKKTLLIVLTSDRGLCGGFNANINRFAYDYYQKNKDKYDVLDIIFIGKKAADFFKTRQVQGKRVTTNMAKEISYSYAADLAKEIKEDFSTGAYDEVQIVYNEFKSAIQQNVVCEKLLPIDLEKSEFEQSEMSFAPDLIFEPAPEEMIESLLDKHFAMQVFRCMSESVAAEHGARMTAMENSTKNAKEMIDNLTITYNKLRQASITTELTEITSGAEALKG